MLFEKYHKIKILGDEDNKGILNEPQDEIIIEEKIDGGNFRIMFHNKEVTFGSHTQELRDDNPNKDFFKRTLQYVKEKIENSDLDGSYIFYGEACVKHTMDYDWEKIPPYLGFDIKNLETHKYFDYDTKKYLFEQLGLPMVPLIKRCKAKDVEVFTEENIPLSFYPSPNNKDHQQCEGIVIKNYSKQLFAKYVREKFKEVNREVFGSSKKWARKEGDAQLLIATYCTNRRIEKMVFKLIAEEVKLEMKMMEVLPKRVTEDIYEEHAKEILWSNWTINFKDIRKKITRRCLSVLKQMIVNNSLK